MKKSLSLPFSMVTRQQAICSTVSNGGACTNSACRRRHDITRCESCGCSLPLGSLEQHRRGQQHLRNVAKNVVANDSGTPAPVESEHPPTPLPDPPILSQLALTPGASSSATSEPTYEPSFTVSHGGGLDFEVEGSEIAGKHSFPPLSLNIFIEDTEMMSRLSIPILKLFPAPDTPESWCGLLTTR